MPARKTLLKKVKPLKVSRQRLKALPISRLLPNITTLMSLCTGLSSIKFSLEGRFEIAVIAILIAGILDAMDGRLARLLGASSHFGAELDSLSDFVSFGVAPAMVLYIGALYHWAGFGWAVALFFVICSALRLARFNTTLLIKEDLPEWMAGFFVGVPAPAGAFLALLPLMFNFAMNENYTFMPILYTFSLLIAGALMVSKIPTYSTKGRHVPQKYILPYMLGAGIVITALINAFWFALSVAGLVYLSSLYFSYKTFKNNQTI